MNRIKEHLKRYPVEPYIPHRWSYPTDGHPSVGLNRYLHYAGKAELAQELIELLKSSDEQLPPYLEDQGDDT